MGAVCWPRREQKKNPCLAEDSEIRVKCCLQRFAPLNISDFPCSITFGKELLGQNSEKLNCKVPPAPLCLESLISLGQVLAAPWIPSSCVEVNVQQRSPGLHPGPGCCGMLSQAHISMFQPQVTAVLHELFCSSPVSYKFYPVLSNQFAPVFVFVRSQSRGIFLLLWVTFSGCLC